MNVHSKMNIDFAKTIEFLELATYLEHSRRNFVGQMITGRAISSNFCTMTFGTPYDDPNLHVVQGNIPNPHV